jgi:hypothetical protein
VFPSETNAEALSWYLAERPEHAGARSIEYAPVDYSRDAWGGLAECWAAMQPKEFSAVYARVLTKIDGTSRDLPVVHSPRTD